MNGDSDCVQFSKCIKSNTCFLWKCTKVLGYVRHGKGGVEIKIKIFDMKMVIVHLITFVNFAKQIKLGPFKIGVSDS